MNAKDSVPVILVSDDGGQETEVEEGKEKKQVASIR